MWLDKYVDVDAVHLLDLPQSEINVIEFAIKVAANDLNHDYFSYEYNPFAQSINKYNLELLELLQDNGFKFVITPNNKLRVYFNVKKAKELYTNAR